MKEDLERESRGEPMGGSAHGRGEGADIGMAKGDKSGNRISNALEVAKRQMDMDSKATEMMNRGSA
jgi:hypothetical protein